jgi:hypothetical protein
MVPKRQLMILNFDEWTASDEAAQASMRDVAQFLQLSHFNFRVFEAHNTHANRSVGALTRAVFRLHLGICPAARLLRHRRIPCVVRMQLSHFHANFRRSKPH